MVLQKCWDMLGFFFRLAIFYVPNHPKKGSASWTHCNHGAVRTGREGSFMEVMDLSRPFYLGEFWILARREWGCSLYTQDRHWNVRMAKPAQAPKQSIGNNPLKRKTRIYLYFTFSHKVGAKKVKHMQKTCCMLSTWDFDTWATNSWFLASRVDALRLPHRPHWSVIHMASCE